MIFRLRDPYDQCIFFFTKTISAGLTSMSSLHLIMSLCYVMRTVKLIRVGKQRNVDITDLKIDTNKNVENNTLISLGYSEGMFIAFIIDF